jgi:hypothetical protein
MLNLFRRTAQPVPPPAKAKPLLSEAVQMATAEWHAARSQLCEAAGDPYEAREHLKDAGEFLVQIGGPRWPKEAGEIYQWCAGRRALEW